MQPITEQSRFRGVLIGTAVGDSLGLPAEGISRHRLRKLCPKPWRHRFVLGRGMVSDDTDHTVFLCQALLVHPNSVKAFAQRFAWSLRWWLLSLPAGIGFGTLRAIGRLWLGFSPSKSGVGSAGNGPAMRSAPVGAMFWRDPEKLSEYVEASTILTHSDPRALVGAKVVAVICAWCFRDEARKAAPPAEFIGMLHGCGTHDSEWLGIVDAMAKAVEAGWSVRQYADSLGLESGVSGYIYHTVPVASYAWYHHFGNFEQTLSAVLDCGGDTDTAGAIAGALAGAAVGDSGIPVPWVRGVVDWPRGRSFLHRLADRLYSASRKQQPAGAVSYFWPAVIVRNLLFLLIVLAHGFRRLAPPY